MHGSMNDKPGNQNKVPYTEKKKKKRGMHMFLLETVTALCYFHVVMCFCTAVWCPPTSATGMELQNHQVKQFSVSARGYE